MTKTYLVSGYCPRMEETCKFQADVFLSKIPHSEMISYKCLQVYCEYQQKCGFNPSKSCTLLSELMSQLGYVRAGSKQF